MVRKVFTLIAAISVLLNLAMDIRQYQHFQATHAINDWVNQSRKILNVIDKMIISAVEGAHAGGWPSLTEQIPALNAVMDPKDEVLNEGLIDLEELLERPLAPAEQHMEAIKILNTMRTYEESLLEERIERERQENLITDNRIMQANLLDIFLISLMIFFFWYERRQTRRTNAYLTQSIERLNSVNEVLLASASQRQSLLRTTVHDLKNPLGSIKGFAELIRHEANSPRSVTDMSETIQRISNNTLNLVSSLLKQESPDDEEKSTSLSVIDLNHSLSEVCMFMRPIADQKRQRIEFKPSSSPCWIKGDTQKLQDAFYNLISNGLKFSPAGSVVSVQCSSDSRHAEVRVIDQGPGFKPEDLKNIFLPGQTLSAKPTGNESSTGIGLFSAKQCIEMNAGKIEAKNDPAGGACFLVEFPCAQPESESQVSHEKNLPLPPV